MFVSIVMLRGLVAELEARGLSAEPVLKDLRVGPERLSDLRGGLSVDEFRRAVCLAIEMTGEPGLGLEMGANAPENMLQLVGHLMLSAGTMREAFNLFSRYSTLLVSGLSYALEEQSERALFRLSFEPDLLTRKEVCFGSEYCMAIALRIGRHFAPSDRPLEVWFAHPAPPHRHRYSEVFGCPVLFERPYIALFFSRHLLDKPHLHGDDTMRSVLRDAAEQFLTEAQRGVTTAERLRGLLRAQRDLADVDSELLARRLGLTRRSLRRRLRSEGMTLSTIVDEERCRVACHELSRPGSCIKETAERLGYSEPSAFHRAFKRWTGKTPAQFSRSAHFA